jgi:hypothetical protein
MLSLDFIGLADQGQISRLMMARLEGCGLIENTGGRTKGANAWWLTRKGGGVDGACVSRVIYVIARQAGVSVVQSSKNEVSASRETVIRGAEA